MLNANLSSHKVDKNRIWSDNTSMKTLTPLPVLASACLGFAFFSSNGLYGAETTSLSTLYWCANRTDNQLQLKPASDCEPLLAPQKGAATDDAIGGEKPTSILNLETAVGTFLTEYRRLLRCCANDVSSMEEIAKLEEQGSAIIADAVSKMPPAAFLAVRNQALIIPVVEARSKLRLLAERLQQVNASQERVDSLDYEQAAKERRRLQDSEDAISKEFRPKGPPSRALTGTSIGTSGKSGEDIGKSATSGPQIGTPSTSGSGIGTTPPTLQEIADTTPFNRPVTPLSTTEPVSRGKVGHEIGTTPRTGPSIGDSPLNSRNP